MINNYSYQHDGYVMHALRGDAIGGYVKWQQAYLLFCYASTHTTKTSILQKQHSQFVYTCSKGYLNFPMIVILLGILNITIIIPNMYICQYWHITWIELSRRSRWVRVWLVLKILPMFWQSSGAIRFPPKYNSLRFSLNFMAATVREWSKIEQNHVSTCSNLT